MNIKEVFKYILIKNIILLFGLILITISIFIVSYYPNISINYGKINTTSIIGLWSTILKSLSISLIMSAVGSKWWVILSKNELSFKKAIANTKCLSFESLLNIKDMNFFFIIIFFISILNIFTSFWVQQCYKIINVENISYKTISIPTLNITDDIFSNFYQNTKTNETVIYSYDEIIMTTGINLIKGNQIYDYSQFSILCSGNCTIPYKKFYGVNITCDNYIKNKTYNNDILNGNIYFANTTMNNNGNFYTNKQFFNIFWSDLNNGGSSYSCSMIPATYNGTLYVFNNGTIFMDYTWIENDDNINSNSVVNRYLPIMFYEDIIYGNISISGSYSSNLVYTSPLIKYIAYCPDGSNNCKINYPPEELIKTGVLHLLSYGF
jgi:hypothetical protein